MRRLVALLIGLLLAQPAAAQFGPGQAPGVPAVNATLTTPTIVNGNLTGTVSVNSNAIAFPGLPATLTYMIGSFVNGDCVTISGTAGGLVDFGSPCGSGGGGGGGTVTSVGLTMPGIFGVAGGPVTSAGTLAVTLATQSANRVFAGPGSGGAAAPTFRALVGGDLPPPTGSTLGGVQSLAAVAHQWINTISTGGVPSATQPACSDLSSAGTGCTVNTGTSGATVPLNNGGFTQSGLANFTSTFQIGGTSQAFPASGSLVGTTDTQTLSSKTLSAPAINGGTITGATMGGVSNFTGTFEVSGTTQTFPASGAIAGLADVQTLTATVLGGVSNANTSTPTTHPTNAITQNNINTFGVTDTVTGSNVQNGFVTSVNSVTTITGSGTLQTGHAAGLTDYCIVEISSMDLCIGVESIMENNNSGTVLTLESYLAKLANNTGALTNFYGYTTIPPTNNTGTITNVYEHYCGFWGAVAGVTNPIACLWNQDPAKIIYTNGPFETNGAFNSAVNLTQTTSPQTPNFFDVNDTVTGAFSTGAVIGNSTTLTLSGTGSGSASAYAIASEVIGNDALATGNWPLLYNIQTSMENTGGQTLTNAAGVNAQLTANTGTIINWTGFQTALLNNAGGTITNWEDLRCPLQSTNANVGTVTNWYCVYNADPAKLIYTAGPITSNSTIGTFIPITPADASITMLNIDAITKTVSGTLTSGTVYDRTMSITLTGSGTGSGVTDVVAHELANDGLNQAYSTMIGNLASGENTGAATLSNYNGSVSQLLSNSGTIINFVGFTTQFLTNAGGTITNWIDHLCPSQSGGGSVGTVGTWYCLQNLDASKRITSLGPVIFGSPTGGIPAGGSINISGAYEINGTSIFASANTWSGTQTFGTIGGYLVSATAQSGTTYTMASTDCGTFLRFSGSSPVTVTLPNNLGVGCQVAMEQAGTGQITLSPASGATLHSAHSYTKTFAQYSIINTIVDTDTGGSSAVYVLSGDGA